MNKKQVTVNFKKLNPFAVIPTKASEGAGGFDLVTPSYPSDYQSSYVEYDTGIAVAIPEGYVGLLVPRSSVSETRWQLCNSIGIIDSDFRGSIKMRFTPSKLASTTYNVQPGDIHRHTDPYTMGDRIGQLVIVPCPTVEFEEVDELPETDRGDGGYGSTGK